VFSRKLEVRKRSLLTDVVILDVSSGLLLRLDDFMGLFDEMLHEHLCRYGDHECGVVGASVNIFICVDDLLHSCDCKLSVNQKLLIR
jgi:hypothetical protein